MIAQAWDSPQDKFKQDLRQVIDSIEKMLIEKNTKYGDAVLSPKRIFSKADTKEQIRVRLDDKISRIMNQQGNEDEDVYGDTIGYLIMYKIAELREKKAKSSGPTPRAISPMQPGVVGIAYASSSPVTITSSNFEPNF